MQFAFWLIWSISLVVKVAVAALLAPFGDEAFYWQESRELAWSYTDLPPAAAFAIRLGETVFGHHEFGMRSVFLLLGALIPLVIRRLGTEIFDARAGALAGIGWMLLPLGATLGVLALPDVPLTFAAVVALLALCRALRDDRLRDWLVLGLALALAWVAHYRAAMLVLAGLAVFTGSRAGRTCWRRPGLWLALALGAAGLVPLVAFNMQHGWRAASFQLVERHPWQFHADALVQPLEQAVVTTPLLYGLILLALWQCWRRRREAAHWGLLAWSGAVFVLGYFVLGLFADDVRFRVHWPLPGYVPALVALPVVIGGARRWLVPAFTLAALGSVVALGYLALATRPASATLLAHVKAFPENFVGWREAGALTGEHWAAVRRDVPDALLVADNFLLAAELDYRLDGAQPVYVLDHPLNTKHGRAPQLALWSRDESALATMAGRPVLFVVEESAGRDRDKKQWIDGLCGRIAGMQLIERVQLYDGRKQFAWHLGQVPVPGDASCPGR